MLQNLHIKVMNECLCKLAECTILPQDSANPHVVHRVQN